MFAEDLSKKLRAEADEHFSDMELFDLLTKAAEFVEHVEWKLDRIDERIDAVEDRLNQSDNP
jgi:hypothetical protein